MKIASLFAENIAVCSRVNPKEDRMLLTVKLKSEALCIYSKY